MMRASPRLGARGPGPPGWPGLGVGGAPGGRRPPRPGFAAAATCLHRDQLLPPLRREGEGAGLWSRRSPWPIGAPHANEGARHTAAGAGRAGPSPPPRSGPPGNAAAAPQPGGAAPRPGSGGASGLPRASKGPGSAAPDPARGWGGNGVRTRPRGDDSRNHPRLTAARAPLSESPPRSYEAACAIVPVFRGSGGHRGPAALPRDPAGKGQSWDSLGSDSTVFALAKGTGERLSEQKSERCPSALGLWEPEPRSKPVPTAQHPPYEEAAFGGLASAGSVRLRRHLPC